MADTRPDLDVIFAAHGEDATVTVPAIVEVPVSTSVIRQAAHNDQFPADTGNNSLTKGRPRFSLRLDELGVTEIPYGTVIVIGAETWFVEATDVLDDQVAHVLARKVEP